MPARLTSWTPSTSSSSRKLLRAFSAGKLRILIASDRASRGLDLRHLAHIVNYDMATSVTSYVHRVGRTARAGRAGSAWTLFTDPEARWFWRDVAGAEAGPGLIRRAGKVQRIRVTEEKSDKDAFEEKVRKYEDALGRLGKEAGEARRRGKGN